MNLPAPRPTVGDVLPLLASPAQRAILERHARAARREEQLLLGGASLLLGLGVAALVLQLGGLLTATPNHRPEFAELDPRDIDYAEELVRDGETPAEAARRAMAARATTRGHAAAYKRVDEHRVPRGHFSAASQAGARTESVFHVSGGR